MMPNPSLNGSKSTIQSYRTRNFFLRPEKYRCLVVNRWRMFQTRWPGPALAEGVVVQLAGDLPAAGAALSDAAFHSANGYRRSSSSAVLSRSLPTMPPSKCCFRL